MLWFNPGPGIVCICMVPSDPIAAFIMCCMYFFCSHSALLQYRSTSVALFRHVFSCVMLTGKVTLLS